MPFVSGMLKRFFKNSPAKASTVLTLKQRMEAFWKWFSENSEKFYQAIESGSFDQYTSEFSTKINEILPGVAWVFGPGDDDEGHSLTLSPEGDPYQDFVVTHIVKNAPLLEGWTFYSSRQASPTFAGMSMDIAGEKVTAKEIWVSPTVDEAQEKIDVVCWAPVFEQLEDGPRGQITFLWLDEALGEFQVTSRLGAVDIEPTSLDKAIQLSELPDFVAKTEAENEWERKTPGEYYTGYSMRERAEFDPVFLRSDIFTGTSLLFEISRDYASQNGSLDHPLPNWGVDFVFVALPVHLFTAEKQIDERADIEDALAEKYDINGAGIVLGGASGRDNIYIEIAILDGERGMRTLLDVIKGHPIGKCGKVYYFDKGRVSREITK